MIYLFNYYINITLTLDINGMNLPSELIIRHPHHQNMVYNLTLMHQINATSILSGMLWLKMIHQNWFWCGEWFYSAHRVEHVLAIDSEVSVAWMCQCTAFYRFVLETHVSVYAYTVCMITAHQISDQIHHADVS